MNDPATSYMVPMSESPHKVTNAHSLRSPMVDEERTKPGHSLGQYFQFLQCFDTVGWPLQKSVLLIPKHSLLEQLEEVNQGGWLTQVHLENSCYNGSR